jgi:3-oxoacyl-[acyl-carrier protein] reductase
LELADDEHVTGDRIRAALPGDSGLNLMVVGYSVFSRGAIDELAPTDWWSIVDANLSQPFRLIRSAAPMLRESTGAIVIVSSDWGVRGLADASAFSASTAGLIGLMRALARELAPCRVNVVAPGETATPELDLFALPGDTRSDVEWRRADLTFLKRVATPDDVAAAIAFLGSDQARHITGQVVSINGGRTRD